MIRNRKIQKMLKQNSIEGDNFTLVMRLKTKIEQLKKIIAGQQQIITEYKKDIKSTKMNQMEIEIQHLNDQNKRLALIVQQFKSKIKNQPMVQHNKKSSSGTSKEKQIKNINYFELNTKFSQILKQNDILKREVLNFKINQQNNKKKQSINDKLNIAITKNVQEYQKLLQQKMDLQAQKALMGGKIAILQQKIDELLRQNEQLSLQIKKCPKSIQSIFKL